MHDEVSGIDDKTATRFDPVHDRRQLSGRDRINHVAFAADEVDVWVRIDPVVGRRTATEVSVSDQPGVIEGNQCPVSRREVNGCTAIHALLDYLVDGHVARLVNNFEYVDSLFRRAQPGLAQLPSGRHLVDLGQTGREVIR